jgi:hypothetical protein
MEQQITVEQLQELPAQSIEKLFDWLVSRKYITPDRFLVNDPAHGKRLTLQKRLDNGDQILIIGHLLEFLYENKKGVENFHPAAGCYGTQGKGWHVVIPQKYQDDVVMMTFEGENLRDALWEAVKSKLNHEA